MNITITECSAEPGLSVYASSPLITPYIPYDQLSYYLFFNQPLTLLPGINRIEVIIKVRGLFLTILDIRAPCYVN